MLTPVLIVSQFARGYENRIHIKIMKIIAKNDTERERERERERYIEREREYTHRQWDTSAWFKQLLYTRVNPVIYFLVLRFKLYLQIRTSKEIHLIKGKFKCTLNVTSRSLAKPLY